jgi:hypothetical protein
MAMLPHKAPSVIVGTPICRNSAYILDKFMSNQKQIQLSYPSSELVLATCESELVEELRDILAFVELRGTVIKYDVIKPEYAKSNIWNITCGREAIRRYVLDRPGASRLLFLDSDMVFEPPVIRRLEREMTGYDLIFSGYALRNYGKGLVGAGCMMITSNMLEKIKFRCYEFKNGQVIFEDNLIEMDVFQAGGKIRKGYFVSVDHYVNESVAIHLDPQEIDVIRRVTSSSFVRYCLIKASVILKWNIPWALKVFLNSPHKTINGS